MLQPKLLVVSLLSLGLAGCGHFMPQQKPEIVKQLSSVQDNLAKARATLAVDAAAPYSKLEPHMVAALAAAQQAVDLADARSAALQGKVAGAPANRIRAIMGLCRDVIKSNTEFIKANGVSSNEDADLTTIMDGTCSIAKFAEELSKR